MQAQPYPVHYTIVPSERFSRLQLLARVLAFIALGLVGMSFGAVFCAGYVLLPAFAASWIASHGSDLTSYPREVGPRVLGGLRWFAAVSAWAGLVAEHLPAAAPDETVHLAVDRDATPTAGGVLVRLLTGLPSAFVLAILGWIGVFVWLWAALTILIGERVGPGAHRYLVGLQRWSVRLLAYQAGLVDDYPPFSFADREAVAPPGAPRATLSPARREP